MFKKTILAGLICSLNTVAIPLASAAPVTEQQLDQLAQNLKVTYKVEDNLSTTNCDIVPDVTSCFLLSITLNMPAAFTANNWELYFSNTAPIGWDGSDEFDITHINGDYHRITPTDKFTGFKAGQDYNIPFTQTHAFVSESDAMPNYFVVAEGMEPVIVRSTIEVTDDESLLTSPQHAGAFTEEKQLRLSAKDNSELADAAWLYKFHQQVNAAGKYSGEAPRTIPAIQKTQVTGEKVSIAKGLNIVSADIYDVALGWLNDKGITVSESGLPVSLTFDEQLPVDGYELSIKPEGINVKAGSGSGQFYALVTLANLIDQNTNTVVAGQYSDAPRYGFRGMHLDVSRNFHSKEMVLRMLDNMAQLKMNKVHLHLADDEGWRLEIPGLPELTDVGAFRCYDPQEQHCLLPQLASGPFRDTPVNGYYSVADYQDILRYAKARHIEVIPSLDMPGHSRAAIKSMEARYQTYIRKEQPEKAREYLLTEFDDTTEYRSIQFYSDNTLNPCLPATYHFVDKVLQEVKKMHDDAGMPLNRYHIGADETAGAWVESPTCQALMKEHNIEKTEELTGYFVERVTRMVNDMGVIAGAWSDGLSHVNQDKLAPRIHANIWDTLPNQGHNRAHDYANRGWDTVLSLPDALYFDFPYQVDPKEPGYYWAARGVNSYKIFQFMPDNLPVHAEFWRTRDEATYEAKDSTPLKNGQTITGIQGQLWSETVRTDKRTEYMIYPRLVALAERAWHKADWEVEYKPGQNYGPETNFFTPSLQKQQAADWQGFSYALTNQVLPTFARNGSMFRLPLPGAVIDKGVLHANSLWAGLNIEYRVNQGEWRSYTGPVAVKGNVQLRTRLPELQRSSRVIDIDHKEQ